MKGYDDTIKIMVFGDESDETRSLTLRYISGFFMDDDDLKLTIGVDFYSKVTNFNDKKIKLQLWTFGGEERFRFLLHQYCKGVRGGLFVFDIADSSSIAHIDDWLSVIRKEDRADIPIFLVGIIPDEKNKRKVSAQEGKKIATSKNLNGYFECNLKTGENIEKVFDELTKLILADPSYTPSKRTVEDLSLFCYKCKKELTTEEFRNHPCFTTGAVNVRGAIMGEPKQLFSKRIVVALSYFYRQKGPLVFYSYPENLLSEEFSVSIANIMDQTVSEGFFTHYFEKHKSYNYYFEIPSDWARGNKEMLMVSIIFDQQINSEIEQNLNVLCTEFLEKLLSNEESYTAFYINDINKFEESDKDLIYKSNSLIKLWIKELYWAAFEDTREKSEVEKIATLLNKKFIFLTLKKLSKGPIALDELREWFNDTFPKSDFKELIDTLVSKQFIFINQIGNVEKYVCLLKEVSAKRIPPDSVIEYLDENPDLIDLELIELLLPKVQEYFSIYENKVREELEEDSFTLFQIVSDPKKYNLLTELRIRLISKDKLPKLVSKRALDHLNSSLSFLKKHDVIEELKYKNERYIFLKTDIQITTAFPEYLRHSLPHRIDDDDERFPYPYIFKPPEPPDDLAMAPRVQLHSSPKKKDSELKIHCQYCGMKFTKEEHLSHSCKKKPEKKL